METSGLIALLIATLAAAAYAQYRLRFHTGGPRQLWFTRLLLIVLGLAFGWVTSTQYPVSGVTALIVFWTSFGVVHVPAAFILFIKRKRGEWH